MPNKQDNTFAQLLRARAAEQLGTIPRVLPRVATNGLFNSLPKPQALTAGMQVKVNPPILPQISASLSPKVKSPFAELFEKEHTGQTFSNEVYKQNTNDGGVASLLNRIMNPEEGLYVSTPPAKDNPSFFQQTNPNYGLMIGYKHRF